MTPEILCCPPFKNGWKLVVLLLLSNFSAGFSLLLVVPRYQKWRKTSCFAAIFKLFALLFSNCDKIVWKNRTFRKTFRIQIFSAATHSKMDENWLFCCCFQIFQLVFHYFWQFPGGKLNVLLLFSNCLRFFPRILTNFRKFSEISWKKYFFLKKKWIQKFSAANHSKMNEN